MPGFRPDESFVHALTGPMSHMSHRDEPRNVSGVFEHMIMDRGARLPITVSNLKGAIRNRWETWTWPRTRARRRPDQENAARARVAPMRRPRAGYSARPRPRLPRRTQPQARPELPPRPCACRRW